MLHLCTDCKSFFGGEFSCLKKMMIYIAFYIILETQIFLFSALVFKLESLLLMLKMADSCCCRCNAIEIVTFQYVLFRHEMGGNIGLSWFSVMVFWQCIHLALLNSCRHWLVNERPSTLNFSHFPNLFDCSNASPEARTVLSLFLFLFFLGQKVLSTEHKIRIVSKMCQRGPEGCPAACGLSSDGYLAGKFKFITKNRWISQLPLTSKCGYRKQSG